MQQAVGPHSWPLHKNESQNWKDPAVEITLAQDELGYLLPGFVLYQILKNGKLIWMQINRSQSLNITVRCALPWPPNELFLQARKSGYANLINGHASLQSPTGKWRNNKLLKTGCFVFYEHGGRYPDWLTCRKSLLGGHGKVRRTVKPSRLNWSVETFLSNQLRVKQ